MNALSVGPLALSIQYFLVILAIVIAWIVAAILGRQRQVAAADALFSLVLLALVGARVVFVARYWPEFSAAPLSIIDIRDGGFDAWGALLVAAVWLPWRLRRQVTLRVPLLVATTVGVGFWGITTLMVGMMEQKGRQLPNVILETLEEEPLALAEAINPEGGTVVNLWATWCPPCQREMPVFERAQNKYPEHRFVFINQGEASWTVQQYLQRQGLNLDHMLLDKHARMSLAVGAQGLPATLFYDANGQLVDFRMGEVSAATLSRSLKKLSTPENQSQKESVNVQTSP